MNTPIEINIGLVANNQDLAPHAALGAIHRAGFTVSASRIAIGEWDGELEPTLVAVIHWHGPEPLWQARIHGVSVETGQDCIAVCCDGKGDLIGPRVGSATFDLDFFHAYASRAPLPVIKRVSCDGVELVIASVNRKGYVGIVDVDTVLPKSCTNGEDVYSYLLADYGSDL